MNKLELCIVFSLSAMMSTALECSVSDYIDKARSKFESITVPQCVDKARLKLGSIADIVLGLGSISTEDEQLVKALKEKAGITREVPIRNMSTLAKLIFGFENGFVFSPGIFDRMYLNKEWLSELSQSEKEFLIAHELMHVKHRDVFYAILAKLLKDKGDKRAMGDQAANQPYSLRRDLGLDRTPAQHAVVTATIVLHNLVKRICEKRADFDAVKLLGTGEGGSKLLSGVREFKVKGPWYRKMHACLNRLTYPLLSLPVIEHIYLDHPTYENRIKDITAQQFAQDTQTAAEDTLATDTVNENT